MARIIVIDDEPGMRRTTRRALQRAGHTVAVYANGAAAIDALGNEPADLLITDIFMPEMEGLETIGKARALNPKMPIIAMSGVSFEGGDYLRIAEKFGAVASLRKPFRLEELVDMVERLLAGAGSG
jgi:DNA-binding NtrC family response regulator